MGFHKSEGFPFLFPLLLKCWGKLKHSVAGLVHGCGMDAGLWHGHYYSETGTQLGDMGSSRRPHTPVDQVSTTEPYPHGSKNWIVQFECGSKCDTVSYFILHCEQDYILAFKDTWLSP